MRQSLVLIILVEHLGVKKWAEISKRLGSKSELQVRERFCNILDTSVGRNVWDDYRTEKLLELVEENEYCWKKMAKLEVFKNKTDNCLWRKFRNLMVAHSNEEIMERVGRTKEALALKIIKYKKNLEERRRSSTRFRPA